MIAKFKVVLKNESGASLLLVLVISSLLLILITTLVHVTNTDLVTATKQDHQMSAYYVAEAGIQRTVYELNASLKQGVTLPTDFQDSDFYGGSYSVHVSTRVNTYGENIGYLITSTGTYHGEQEVITDWVQQKVWPGNGDQPTPLQFAIYGEQGVSITTIPSLLGTGLVNTNVIQIAGNAHANDTLSLVHLGLNPPQPIVNGILSSTNVNNIQAMGVAEANKMQRNYIPIPTFDFDRARQYAKQNGTYLSGNSQFTSTQLISLLGITPLSRNNLIFVDGDLNILAADLLGISLQNRTIIVNGSITGTISLGGNTLAATSLNLIAKESITFDGVATGLQVHGILFAQGMNPQTNQPDPSLGVVRVGGQADVTGYLGGRIIQIGAGLIESVTGPITGAMHFQYDASAFRTLPAGIGFKQNQFQIVEQEGP